MKITLNVRSDWLTEYRAAIGDDGANDDEHDLLCEIGNDVEQQVCCEAGLETDGKSCEDEQPELATTVVTITAPPEAVAANQATTRLCQVCAQHTAEAYMSFGWSITVQPIEQEDQSE